jgi:hypothetical protein
MTALNYGTMDFPAFNKEAQEVLRYPNDTRHEHHPVLWATLWPSHMERALNAIAESEEGPRPREAWIDLLRETMRKDGWRPPRDET